MIPWLKQDDPFPDVADALDETTGFPGLLAAGADLSPERLIEAYRHGIFPWFSEGQPILWWCTNPRMVLPTDSFVVSHSLKKKLKQIHKSIHSDGRWKLTFDTAFERVILECAGPRRHADGTWITEEIVHSYIALHKMGIAHSSELWFDNQLVGGAYGICLGKMFFGESMFAHVSDASKVTLAHLVFFLRENGVELIDCQQETAHLTSLGAHSVSRDVFSEHLHRTVDLPTVHFRDSGNCPLCNYFK